MHIIENVLFIFFLSSVFQASAKPRDSSCNECVNYNFESDFEGLFTNEGLCDGLSTWTEGTYSTVDVTSPNEFAKTFIKPGTDLSCTRSFPFSMTSGGTVDVNLYISDSNGSDMVQVLAEQITASGNNPTMGFGSVSPMDANFVNGWETLTFTLIGSETFNGRIIFVALQSENATVLIDSFCYKPASYEGDCWVLPYPTTTVQPEITTEWETKPTTETEWETTNIPTTVTEWEITQTTETEWETAQTTETERETTPTTETEWETTPTTETDWETAQTTETEWETTNIPTTETEWETETTTDIDSTTTFVTYPSTDTDSTTSFVTNPTTDIDSTTTDIESSTSDIDFTTSAVTNPTSVTETDATTAMVTDPTSVTSTAASTVTEETPDTEVTSTTALPTVIVPEPTLPTPAPDTNKCPVDPFVHWLLPHEYDCNLFYYCVWGEKVLRNCAAGLHFNPIIQVCDWPWSAGCTTL